MRKLVFIGITLSLLSCSTDSREEHEVFLLGSWDAQWTTLATSYPGVDNVDFSMNGLINFNEDSVRIRAYGYKGCIFSEDTLSHALRWSVTGDTLHLINEDNVRGMSYQILSKTSQEVRLQLMEDIFLTLTKE